MNIANQVYRYIYILVVIFLISIAVYRIVLTYNIFNHTFDEPVYIACGVEWLERGSYLYGLDHPPLGPIAFGYGPYISGIRLSETQHELIDSGEVLSQWWSKWESGMEILHNDNNYFHNLSLARLGNLPFYLLISFITWLWSRRLFGGACALISLFFITTIPSIIGHSGLATTDIPIASLCLAGIYAFMIWFEAPNYWHSTLFGLTWGLSAISKFSALLFLPVSALTILISNLIHHKKTKYENIRPQKNIVLQLHSKLLVAGTIAFLVVWAGYRFSLTPIVPIEHRPHSNIDRIIGNNDKVKDIIYSVAEKPIFPLKDFVVGILMQKAHNEKGHLSYLLGDYSNDGWWYFYPIVFLIKTPISFLFFVSAGSIFILREYIKDGNIQTLLPLVLAISILLSVLPANINLGIRYILIVYPLFAIIAGYGVTRLVTLIKWRKYAISLVFIFIMWYIASTSLIHPDYISYFNEIASKSPESFRNDSDLDWGQDLNRLSIELKRRNVNELSLAYFGTADPEKFDLPPFKLLGRHQKAKGWIAISLFMLKDIAGPPPHDGYQWIEEYEPIAIVGKSIKLFYIEAEQ